MEFVRLRACFGDRPTDRPATRITGSVAVRIGLPVVLLFLSIAGRASAAVSLATATKTSVTSTTTATIASFNPGGASKRVLVVGLAFGQGAPTGVGVTF